MRVLIASVLTPFVFGGAEVLVQDLRQALLQEGHDVDLLTLPWAWNRLDLLIDHLTATRLMHIADQGPDTVDRVVAMKFPAYLLQHPHKVLWLMHQQRQAYELWDDPLGLSRMPGGDAMRQIIQHADRLACGEIRSRFTISANVSRRLREQLGIESIPMCPPPRHVDRLKPLAADDYFFFPSRLSPWKRQSLVLEAVARCREPVRVRFAGFRDDSPQLAEMKARATELGIESRVEWLGLLGDDDLVEVYGRSLAVIFPPFDEDYGYITVEAMAAAKAVITCEDSGGPMEWVDESTGWVTEPEPDAMAQALDEAWQDRAGTARRGEQGRETFMERRLSWPHIVERLLA